MESATFNLIQFVCQIPQISPHGLQACPFCVLNPNPKKSGVHTLPWLCEWEMNKVVWTEPHNTIVLVFVNRTGERPRKYKGSGSERGTENLVHANVLKEH